MIYYALIDDDMQIARHRSKKNLAVFTDLKMLKRHAWRYGTRQKKYKVVELEFGIIFDIEEDAQ